MKSIHLHIPALLSKIQEMSNDNMENVKLTMCEEVIDQDIFYPALIHFEGYTNDGVVADYESIDSLSFLVDSLQEDVAI
jgi:hypothetical protein